MNFVGLSAIVVFIGLAVLFSEDRRNISWSQVVWALAAQLFIVLVLSDLGWLSRVLLALMLFMLFFYNADILCKRWFASSRMRVAVSLSSWVLITVALVTLDRLGGLLTPALPVFFALFGVYLCAKMLKIRYFVPRRWGNSWGAIYLLLGGAIIFSRNISGLQLLQGLSDMVSTFLNFYQDGTRFILGPLSDSAQVGGFVFAITLFCSAVFFTAMMAFFDSLGLTAAVVLSSARFISWHLNLLRVKPLSGMEALVNSANIVLSMQASPLLVRDLLAQGTRSEYMTMMVSGMATIAGGTMAIFINMGVPADYLLTASVLSSPASILMAKIVVPETEQPVTLGGGSRITISPSHASPMVAITNGVTLGAKIGVGISAMVLVFISLIALLNASLAYLDSWVDGVLLGGVPLGERSMVVGGYPGLFPSSFQQILQALGSPIAWLMGVPSSESGAVGELLALKISANEAVGYARLVEMMKEQALSPRSVLIASYALCGFANFGSLGILFATLKSVAPTKQEVYVKLGIRSIFFGAFASWMTAAFAGVFMTTSL